VIMEYAPYGNLRDYLRKHRTHDTSDQCDQEPADNDDVISGDSKCLTYSHLLSFAVQVARGLQFLTARLVSDRFSDVWICMSLIF